MSVDSVIVCQSDPDTSVVVCICAWLILVLNLPVCLLCA